MASHKKTYKIAYVTGTRAEFGYFRHVLQTLKKRGFNVLVVATGMHTVRGFGNTFREVKGSGLRTIALKDGTDGKSLSRMAAATGKNLAQLSALFAKEKPDIVLVEGDRGEQVAAALAAAYLNIPVLHRAGGNWSGTIDNKLRWALSALADYHFPSNSAFARNLRKSGIPKERIFDIGGVTPDAIARKEFLAPRECRKKYGINEGQCSVLLAYHPDTTAHGTEKAQIEEVLAGLSNFDVPVIAIGANADAGGAAINARLRAYAHTKKNFSFYEHVNRSDYLGLLNCVDALIGNTSSGFHELPSFKKPYVCIGSRQEGRLGELRHILRVPPKRGAIERALKKALFDVRFRHSLKDIRNPYGKGDFYKKFPQTLKRILASRHY
jgi:UDP-hydrolysing UDP-N-acetyl-D-glucosamine 2-epimerase